MTTDRPGKKSWWRLLRIRISVRALIALVLVAGGLLGWLVQSARVQGEAVERLRRLRGYVAYDWEYRHGQAAPPPIPGWRRWLIDKIGPDYAGSVTRVQFGLSPPTAGPTTDDLASIGRLDRLEYLSVLEVPPGRQGLAPLRRLSRLKHLDFNESSGAERNDLAPLGDLAGLEELQLVRSTMMTDDDLAIVAGLTRLRTLALCGPVGAIPPGGPMIGDAGLASLENLRDLRNLQIIGKTGITNAGLSHLRGLTRMETLVLQGGKVTSLEPLRSLVRLEYLQVGGTGIDDPGIDDAGAAALADLTALNTILLDGNKSFTNAGLSHLRALPNLESLYLGATPIDDDGVASLIAIPRLKSVFLSSTKLTDAGLLALVSRPGWARIDVGSTRVTPAGIASARLAAPGTMITP